MERLGSRIARMSKLINQLKKRLEELERQKEENKNNKPYSKIQQSSRLGNTDMVYHNGYFKTYAIYKDEDEA